MRIVVCIGRENGGRPVQKKEIAEAEGIPADYVEQICVRLKAGGLLRSHRGKYGGFSLAHAPGAISVSDVLKAIDGHSALAPCLEGECRRTAICATRHVWERADMALQGVLSGVTIAELAKESKKLTVSKAISFDI